MGSTEIGSGRTAKPLLLDTNVWLDYFVGTRPGHVLAFELVNKAISVDSALCIAVHSSKDLYYLVEAAIKRNARSRNDGLLSEASAKSARAIAWACIDNVIELATAVASDESDIWIAGKQRSIHSDYEDDLLIAAAMRANAILITNDRKLILHSPVAALTVEDALAYVTAKS